MDYLSKFNDVFCEMITDLVKVFPTDSQLRMYKFGLDAYIASDETIISCLFYDQVTTRYAEKIKNQDESFFLEKDFQEFSDYNSVLDVVSKLKSCWLELNDENKVVIWRYFKVLLNLSERYGA
jgi:hypothetical protein